MQELQRDPARSFSAVPIRDAKVGAFISLGLGIVCWIAFPVARPLFLVLAASDSSSVSFSIGRIEAEPAA